MHFVGVTVNMGVTIIEEKMYICTVVMLKSGQRFFIEKKAHFR